MKKYELALVVSPSINEAKIEVVKAKIAEIIKGQKGKIVKSESLGKRALAYRIAKQDEGIFLIFAVEAQNLTPSDSFKIRQVEEVLRFLILRR